MHLGWGLILASLLTTACIEKKPYQRAERENPVSTRLANMVIEEDRLLETAGVESTAYRTLHRTHRQEVYAYLAQALIADPEDLYRAALILNRAEPADAAEACLMAHFLAEAAASEGFASAKQLAAQSMDRYLVLTGKPQLYGTQYYNDSEGRLRLFPVDPNVSDSERALYNVSPLDSLKARLGRGEPD